MIIYMCKMTIIRKFKQSVQQMPHAPMLGYKENRQWKWITRQQMSEKVSYCINALRYQNVAENDRVMYKGKNGVNWLAWDLATNALGATFVPLYHNQNEEYVKHILQDCEPKVFVSKDLHYNSVIMYKDHIPENLAATNDEIPDMHDNTLSKLIYTSGTTGKPKGVMLTQSNILSNIEALEYRFADLQKDKTYTTLNILPWAHIYGLTTELYYNIFNNNKVALSSGPEHFVKEMLEIRPDLLYVVPRILQMIKSKVEWLDRPVVERILPLLLKILFGGNVTTIFVGGSRLDNATKGFYSKHGIILCEGYGCTETSPMVSVNHTHAPRQDDSIGKILENTVVRIIDNEICVAGPGVMKGYYRNEEATQKAFVYGDDGRKYYKTGDEGVLEDGFLHYKGRISENYKLTNGKFVNVESVEQIVKKYIHHPLMVYGNDRCHNILLCESNVPIDLEKINQELDNYLHIRDVLYLEGGAFQRFLTPKMSIKRRDVVTYYQQEIDNMYKHYV